MLGFYINFIFQFESAKVLFLGGISDSVYSQFVMILHYLNMYRKRIV